MSPLGGNFLEANTSMHDGSQGGSVVADEEIGPDGNRSIGLPLLLTDGGVLSTCKMIQR